MAGIPKSERVRALKAADPIGFAARRALADKKWAARNQEKKRDMKRAWIAANPDKVLAQGRAWVKRNREKVRLKVRMANAARRANGMRNPVALVARLMALQKSMCPICKANIANKFHIDHIMPLKLGGTNDAYNLQLLCPPCNGQKKDKHPMQFMQSRGYLL